MEGLLRQDASETPLTLLVWGKNRYDNRYFDPLCGMLQISLTLGGAVAYRIEFGGLRRRLYTVLLESMLFSLYGGRRR